jgi:hypothetical protein
LKSPDYKDIPQEAAVTDFLSRIHQYEKRYETIDDKSERNYSFIKIFNCGERFLVHKIGGKALVRAKCDASMFALRSYSKSCGLLSDEYSYPAENHLPDTSE